MYHEQQLDRDVEFGYPGLRTGHEQESRWESKRVEPIGAAECCRVQAQCR